MRRIAATIGVWLVGNLLWLQSDGLLRDGDEEGHVGAAELLRDLLQSDGLMAWLSASFAGDYGEYPPLYPGLIAAWWTAMGGGVPGATAVRAINLAWPLVAAAAMASMVPRARRALVVALVVLIPGLCGLSRHFMPEGAVVAAVSVVAALSWHAFCNPSWRRAVALGVGVAVALLIKQTAMLYVLGPLLVALWGALAWWFGRRAFAKQRRRGGNAVGQSNGSAVGSSISGRRARTSATSEGDSTPRRDASTEFTPNVIVTD